MQAESGSARILSEAPDKVGGVLCPVLPLGERPNDKTVLSD